jgi:hypothetical protein
VPGDRVPPWRNPTLIAAVGDLAHPGWRASAVGVYRHWRDPGYAIGALLAGWPADRLGFGWAIASVAALTIASGIVVALRLVETRRPAKLDSLSLTPSWSP